MVTPTLGLAGGFALFVLTSIPPIWHRSEERPWMSVLRYLIVGLALLLIVLGLLPILGGL